MAAEEAKDPKRTIPKAYISGILPLVLLAMGVMFFAGGVGDWRTLSNINDPLPQAMSRTRNVAPPSWRPSCGAGKMPAPPSWRPGY